jgi:hypothetical protein
LKTHLFPSAIQENDRTDILETGKLVFYRDEKRFFSLNHNRIALLRDHCRTAGSSYQNTIAESEHYIMSATDWVMPYKQLQCFDLSCGVGTSQALFCLPKFSLSNLVLSQRLLAGVAVPGLAFLWRKID